MTSCPVISRNHGPVEKLYWRYTHFPRKTTSMGTRFKVCKVRLVRKDVENKFSKMIGFPCATYGEHGGTLFFLQGFNKRNKSSTNGVSMLYQVSQKGCQNAKVKQNLVINHGKKWQEVPLFFFGSKMFFLSKLDMFEWR